MIIMGIDPGTAVTGIGVIEVLSDEISLKGFKAIRTSSGEKLPGRLKEIYDEVSIALREFSPEICVVEDIFTGKNVKSALMIGQARACAILAAVNASMEVVEYAPREIKMSVVGNGNAVKEQVQFMVKNILRMRENPYPLDCSDALAGAICHANRMKYNKIYK
jgi:crossover junction endodeoxyribonuclease RuvC